MPVLFGFVLVRTTLAVWPLGALILATPVLGPSPYVAIGVTIVWVLLEALALPL